jgi:chromatin remodeling complex protein RSC6
VLSTPHHHRSTRAQPRVAAAFTAPPSLPHTQATIPSRFSHLPVSLAEIEKNEPEEEIGRPRGGQEEEKKRKRSRKEMRKERKRRRNRARKKRERRKERKRKKSQNGLGPEEERKRKKKKVNLTFLFGPPRSLLQAQKPNFKPKPKICWAQFLYNSRPKFNC